MRKRIGAAVALGSAVLAAVALSGAPSQSRPDLLTRARAFGMPADATLAGASQVDGQLYIVWYRDSAGQLHKIGDDGPPPTPAPDR